MVSSVKSLHIYPVKSLRGISLEASELLDTGLRWDRHWLLVDRHGQFLSQRRLPAMARIATALREHQLVLHCQGQPELCVSVDRPGGEPQLTEVWGDRCTVVDQGDTAARWLARALGSEHEPRLVRMAGGYLRPQKHPERYGTQTHTQFADSAPYLVANQGSLDSLNKTLTANQQAPVPMNRFRPNIVVEGLEAFREHELASLEGPCYTLEICFPSERCIMTTMNQETGEADPAGEPFKTLRRINPMPKPKTGPAFGELTTLSRGVNSTIAVGDILQPGWQ